MFGRLPPHAAGGTEAGTQLELAVEAAGPVRAIFSAQNDRGERVFARSEDRELMAALVADVDVVVDCAPRFEERFLLNREAVRQRKPVRVIFPDQDGLGTLLIPNTVALVSGAPNPEQGQALRLIAKHGVSIFTGDG